MLYLLIYFLEVFWHDPKQCFMRRKTIWIFSSLQCINFHKDCWLHFFLQHDDKSWECVNHHQSPPSLHYWHWIHSKYTTKKYITFCVLTEQGVFTNLIIIIMEMIKIIINIIDKHLSLTIHRSHLISLKKKPFLLLSLSLLIYNHTSTSLFIESPSHLACCVVFT